jgi:hypothetical protein
MKKKEIERISKLLISKPKLVWDAIDEKEKKKVFNFDKEYQTFLNTAKTEREAVKIISEIALKNGFSLNLRGTHPIKLMKAFQGKSIALSVSGKKPLTLNRIRFTRNLIWHS